MNEGHLNLSPVVSQALKIGDNNVIESKGEYWSVKWKEK